MYIFCFWVCCVESGTDFFANHDPNFSQLSIYMSNFILVDETRWVTCSSNHGKCHGRFNEAGWSKHIWIKTLCIFCPQRSISHGKMGIEHPSFLSTGIHWALLIYIENEKEQSKKKKEIEIKQEPNMIHG